MNDQQTCCGEPISLPGTRGKIFLLLVTLEIIALVALTCWTINDIEFPLNDNTRYSFAYAFTVLFNCFCILYFVFDGILRERKEELLAFLAASVLVASYSIFDYFMGCSRSTDCLVRLIVAVAVQPLNFGLGITVLREMGWLKYAIAGANEAFQKLYNQYGTFISLMKVDFQCAVSLTILASFSGVLTETSLILSVLGLWLSIWWLVGAWYAARHEHGPVMYLVFVFAVLEPAFIIYKFVMIATRWDTYQQLITYPLLVLGAACLLLRMVVLVLAWRVHASFGLGLKPHLLNEATQASLTSHQLRDSAAPTPSTPLLPQ